VSKAEEDEVVRLRVAVEVVRRLAWGREFVVKCKGLGRFGGSEGQKGSNNSGGKNSSLTKNSSVNKNNSEMFAKELVKLNFE